MKEIRMAELCAMGGCYEATVGVGYWQGRRGNENPLPRRRADLCRAHHVEAIEADLVRCVVVSDIAEVADVRTDAVVGKGGVVELDPAQTNIAALVAAQIVKVLPPGGGGE